MPRAARAATWASSRRWARSTKAIARCWRRRATGAGFVAMTLFVNPLQFGRTRTSQTYPRTPEADLEAAEAAGSTSSSTPSVAEMYPAGEPDVTVDPGRSATGWRGQSGPATSGAC